MSMEIVISKARPKLSSLIAKAAAGERVYIIKYGKVFAAIVGAADLAALAVIPQLRVDEGKVTSQEGTDDAHGSPTP